jgi:3-hydroxybutyryl-CoA dehydratase
MLFEGKHYNQTAVGDGFSDTLRVTDTHILLGARLIGDYNPLHVNREFAEQSRFGARILHGVTTAAIAGAPVGNYFAGTAIAYLEQNNRFTAPVYAGDTLTTAWTITEKIDKPKANGGIVVLAGTCRNQNGVIVLEANGKMLVGNT